MFKASNTKTPSHFSQRLSTIAKAPAPSMAPKRHRDEIERDSERVCAYESCRIVYVDGSHIRAMIKNKSERGALLMCDGAENIPDIAWLRLIHHKELIKFTVMWRKNTCLGIKIVSGTEL